MVGIVKVPTFAPVKNAEIAQLVEHNLAKVRVASSSLVFRSTGCSNGGIGRHEGLKIPWPLRLCGFKSRFEYKATLVSHRFTRVACFLYHPSSMSDTLSHTHASDAYSTFFAPPGTSLLMIKFRRFPIGHHLHYDTAKAMLCHLWRHDYHHPMQTYRS